MESETFLTTLLKDSLADAREVAQKEWGHLPNETAVAVLAAALFTERVRTGSAALERTIFGKTYGAVPADYASGEDLRAGKPWAEESR